ncbi:MAG TPA: lipoyl synthase [Thermotogota bacterium]|nr:lipoyl synthase [Thermotogota bacterium]
MDMRKPEWIRTKIRSTQETKDVNAIIGKFGLNTVCKEANCPNRMECFSRKTATFMILGRICSRNCTFCDVTHGKPQPVDSDEPRHLALAVQEMGLKYVVVTSVTRDDLSDGGAGHFASVIREIQSISKDIGIEVLIPDFKGDEDALRAVIQAKPKVINHNIETLKRLYPDLRPQAKYERTLTLLKRIKQMDQEIISKSGFMVGLGETLSEVEQLMADLRAHDCEMLTIGQYLQPSRNHYPVIEYVRPDTFKRYEEMGYDMGFKHVVSGPLVRSSYHADEAFHFI